MLQPNREKLEGEQNIIVTIVIHLNVKTNSQGEVKCQMCFFKYTEIMNCKKEAELERKKLV